MTDNSTHLCGGEAPASTSASPQSAVAKPPKRVNFPLPRELRDQIYGYLLHHEYTEHSKYPESKDVELPSSYKFHTSILAVNTQIGEEATEVLRSNDFVRVTTNWADDKNLKALEVPFVCDLAHRNDHFDHLRIDYKLHIESLTVQYDRELKFVVVSSSLTKLCRFLQFLLFRRHFPLVPVVLYEAESKEDRRRQIEIYPDEFSKFNSSIIVHDRIGKPLSEPAKRRLLEPFRDLIIGGQSMEINTILPEHELATFKLFVAPPVMNSLPMTWRYFELALEMKAVADRHALTGHSIQAWQLYRGISFALTAIPYRSGRGAIVLYGLCALVSIDISLCLALIQLTMSWSTQAEPSLGECRRILREDGEILQALFPKLDSVEVKAITARHLAVQWLAMICQAAETRSFGPLAMIEHYSEQKKKVRDIMVLNNHEEVADYFDHDVNYLKSLKVQVRSIPLRSFGYPKLIECKG